MNKQKDEIYLLSIDEFIQYKEQIPPLNTWWWLGSTGFIDEFASHVCRNGIIGARGHYVNSDDGAVRPALKYANLKSKISKSDKGEEYFIFNEVRWKIIDKENEIAISELPIGFERFNVESNNYESSHIRKWLLDWIGKRHEEN